MEKQTIKLPPVKTEDIKFLKGGGDVIEIYPDRIRIFEEGTAEVYKEKDALFHEEEVYNDTVIGKTRIDLINLKYEADMDLYRIDIYTGGGLTVVPVPDRDTGIMVLSKLTKWLYDQV